MSLSDRLPDHGLDLGGLDPHPSHLELPVEAAHVANRRLPLAVALDRQVDVPADEVPRPVLPARGAEGLDKGQEAPLRGVQVAPAHAGPRDAQLAGLGQLQAPGVVGALAFFRCDCCIVIYVSVHYPGSRT